MKKLAMGVILAFSMTGISHAEEGHGLREVMKHLGMEMHAMSDGLLVADYERVIRAASTIAGHGHLSADEEKRIEAKLGKETAQFRKADELVHHRAMELVKVAKTRDPALTAKHYSALMEGCVACHSKFRERLRSDK